MKIPISKIFIDEQEEQEVITVLRSGWIMQGPKVEMLEKEIASYVTTTHAIAVSSGTAALHLSLLALGIKEGDEVIVPSFSFVATSNCVLYVGATPVFADIDKKTFNIEPQDIEKKITKKTKAIIAVHQIGLPAKLDKIQEICKKYKLLLIEDAACALGAQFQGKKIGSFGDVACFSFHPRKSITTGEGGMITTNNKEIAEMLKILRSHGAVKENGKEIYRYLGYNYRMTDLQAAVGLVQYKKLETILQKREEIASFYDNSFKNTTSITVPYIPENMNHTYQSYMIQIHHPKISRDVLAKQLEEKGITTRNGITAIHKEPLYKKLLGETVLPVTEEMANNCLIIPLYTQMTTKEQEYVTTQLKNLLA